MTFYASQAQFQSATIVRNEPIAEATYRIAITCPEIATTMLPGQFVMLRIHGTNDPLIGRPFAMYDRFKDDASKWVGLEIVYLVKGKFTQALSGKVPGNLLEVGGPLGNAFSNLPVDHLVMVVGGVGQTPMLTLGREALGKEVFGSVLGSVIDWDPLSSNKRANGYAKKVTLLYGARTARRLAGVSDFIKAGFDVRLCTDDGTLGEPQVVTTLLQQLLAEVGLAEDLRPAASEAARASIRIVTCGPEAMMAAVAAIAKEKNIACEVSLETPMACGIGICFSCVAKIHQDDGQWDYQRTCVEGPIFDALKLAW